MKKIVVPAAELYDNGTNTFIPIKETTIQIEHSLVSISKWESKWHKPFLSKDQKTPEMFIDYVRCMTLTQNVNPLVYYALTDENIKAIQDYIEDPMTATWFSDKQKKKSQSRIVTSELIYYWMVALQIPFECQKWHLNRLLTLIQVCNVENQPKKKMKTNDILRSNNSINAARRKAMNSKG